MAWFWVFAGFCFLVFLVGLGLAVVSWWEMNRDDVVVISSHIDRESVNKYLKLSDLHKNAIDKEIAVRIQDD